MIKSFKTRATREVFFCRHSPHFPESITRTALRKLWILNAIDGIEELRMPPSNHLERLKGDRKGQYSLRINKQWRICFYWLDKDAYDVEIVDYH
jgi:toxin HigB-1